MHTHQDHDKLMKDVKEHLKSVFEGSKQSMYLFLDDHNKICNENFANLLGYNSPEEWASVNESFTDVFVDEDSQENLVSAYQNAMENLVGSKVSVEWKKKDGDKVETDVILVPFLFKDHLFALHFIN